MSTAMFKALQADSVAGRLAASRMRAPDSSSVSHTKYGSSNSRLLALGMLTPLSPSVLDTQLAATYTPLVTSGFLAQAFLGLGVLHWE